ncbi:hypothetical protein H8B09_25920 [Paenibacillus sp. PR3]|uniref:Type II toxin-antitoxin system PemK/MazF family toxin n=1 Tax=Paenibacillus terricola TaxID=2763503 RepID=A0ABR8N212_9BACL|nr:hypothetical protein [Paenibacillus terricola]MBD3922220.1 hypothetical protein [Paenibacillus terricola]
MMLFWKGEHFIYQSANERSNGLLNPPALLLDDTVVFSSDSDQSVIGGLVVHPSKTEVAFPISNSKQPAMLIVSGIDRARAKLTVMNKYILGLSEDESILDIRLTSRLTKVICIRIQQIAEILNFMLSK